MIEKKHTIKKRMLEVLNFKGYSYTHFFSMTKFSSYNNFKGKRLEISGINTDAVLEFLEIFPDISTEWLLTDQGSMHKTSIGDRFRLLVEKNNMNIDYVKKYLHVNTDFIKNTDFLNIHQLFLITKLFPNVDQRWLITGEEKINIKNSVDNVAESASEYSIEIRKQYDEIPVYTPLVNDYSKRIQQLLDYTMLTPSAFGITCGFSSSMLVQYWLKRVYEPKPESYYKILARYPGLSEEWLFFDEEPMWEGDDYFKMKFKKLIESDQAINKIRTPQEILEALYSVYECNRSVLAKRLGISINTIISYEINPDKNKFSEKTINIIHQHIRYIPKDWLRGILL